MPEMLEVAGDIKETLDWLNQRSARTLLTRGIDYYDHTTRTNVGIGFGVIIENHDGSTVLATLDDTLIYDGRRIRRHPA